MVAGDSTDPGQAVLLQRMQNWLDVTDWEAGIFTAHVAYAKSVGTLMLELYTASELDASGGYGGAPKLLKSFGTIDSRQIFKLAVIPEQGDWPLESFVFWKISAPGTRGEWQALFRIDAVFKGDERRSILRAVGNRGALGSNPVRAADGLVRSQVALRTRKLSSRRIGRACDCDEPMDASSEGRRFDRV